ncbi:hypothetical protein D3C72_1889270 [compost metagenome]
MTCVNATMVMAIIAITPMGMTLRMMATMVVKKIASNAQALAVKPSGVGSRSSVTRTAVVIKAGLMRNGTTSAKYRNIDRDLLGCMMTLFVSKIFLCCAWRSKSVNHWVVAWPFVHIRQKPGYSVFQRAAYQQHRFGGLADDTH